MASTKKTTNGVNGSNGHVSLAREEYDAFLAREESYSELVAQNAKTATRNSEQIFIINSQCTRMAEQDTRITSLERLAGLQRVMIDMLRDPVKVKTLEELSEFWRQWTGFTEREVEKRKITREEVAKFEPDLFKAWRVWVRDEGKKDRELSTSGTREEIEANAPKSQRELQEHVIRRLREENFKLNEKLKAVEAERVADLAAQEAKAKEKEKTP